MRKRILAIASLVCLLLASCGSAEQEPATEKKTLKLAVHAANMLLKELVEGFNEQCEEYEVIICERSEEEYWADYEARIHAEICNGSGPDLIHSSLIDLDNSAKEGYLLDLTKKLKNQKNKLVDRVWQCGTVDDKLYAVPFCFQISTIEVRKDLVGDRTSWTLEELMQLTRESDASVFANGLTGPDIFYQMGIRNESNSHLIDWENGICNLNSPEAIALLEFSKEYANVVFYSIEDIPDGYSDPERIASGEMFAKWHSVSYLQGLQYDDIMYKACETEKVYIGYPVESGESGHQMCSSDIVVNQACKYPDGAVEFLRFLISEEAQEVIVEKQTELSCDFPVRKDSLERMFDKAAEGYYDTDIIDSYPIAGKRFALEPISQKSLQQVWELIEAAEPYSRRPGRLVNMIWEETGEFYSGEKSAKDVLDALQERVQEYLDNMK